MKFNELTLYKQRNIYRFVFFKSSHQVLLQFYLKSRIPLFWIFLQKETNFKIVNFRFILIGFPSPVPRPYVSQIALGYLKMQTKNYGIMSL